MASCQDKSAKTDKTVFDRWYFGSLDVGLLEALQLWAGQKTSVLPYSLRGRGRRCKFGLLKSRVSGHSRLQICPYFHPMIRLLIVLPFLFLACGPSASPQLAETVSSAKVAYSASPLLFPTAHWTRDRAQNVGIDSLILADALRYLNGHTKEDGLEETMVIRHGRLIWAGDSIAKVHDIWSCTKSFTSTAVGLLEAEGKLSLDQAVADHEPLLKALYPTVTYRHFLAMTSGYDAADEGSKNWSGSPFTPDLPSSAPGSTFAYSNEAMTMLGRAATKAAGTSLENYLAETLMYPIGIKNWTWRSEEAMPDGTPVNLGGMGIKMCALDQARFGLLFLNDGVWNGKRLLPEGWVEKATTNQVSKTIKLADSDYKKPDGRGIYGFNWWVIDTPVHAYYTSGLNHNVCLVVPEWDMVIVRMGVDGNPEAGKHKVYSELLRRLAPGIAQNSVPD
jgi:CubicO group peptidase (beta-lactamase class C family)